MKMKGKEKMEKYEEQLRKERIPTVKISGSGRTKIPGLGYAVISGSGIISSEEISISGSGTLPGGIKAKRIVGAGSIVIEGNAEADEMRFSGSTHVAGGISVKIIEGSGSFSSGPLVGESARFSGSCKIRGDVKLEKSFHVYGSLEVSGDLTAKDKIETDGSFDVKGGISTKVFKATLSKKNSYVGKGIRADFIEIKAEEFKGIVIFGFKIFGRLFEAGKLYVDELVAENDVFLENVKCKNVIGGNVVIGKGCVVEGKVKYRNSVSIDPKAVLSHPPEKIEG